MNKPETYTFYVLSILAIASAQNFVSAQSVDGQFTSDIQPLLKKVCFECHANGAKEGSMSFDELLASDDREDRCERWYRVLKKLQAGLMPPKDAAQPSKEQVAKLEQWIKYGAFEIDPKNPDPGQVTIRRLNRIEYRNSIRDLLGVNYDTDANFPADDTGHGFDSIGSVLSISPLLFEKYVNAAKQIVDSTVPKVSGVIRTSTVSGSRFRVDSTPAAPAESARENRGSDRFRQNPIELSYYTPATARARLTVELDGEYTLKLNLRANETYVEGQFDGNKCEFTFSLGDKQLLMREFVRQGGTSFTFDYPQRLAKGEYELIATVRPLSEERQVRNLRIQIASVDLVGPNDPQHFIRPASYEKFFPREVPSDDAGRRAYATELLREFASRAFRRPVDAESLERLVALAEQGRGGGETFEAEIAQAMTAVLASPQFLFREEVAADGSQGGRFPLIDEYSLASRLSYFFWSSMPDTELMRLAGERRLRENLDQQVDRMLADPKAAAFYEHFVGQWLRSRAIETVEINDRAVLNRESATQNRGRRSNRERFFELFRKGENRTPEENAEFARVRESFQRSSRGPQFALTPEVRTAMRRETEMLFEHLVKHDRSLLELLDSDYTFLNETLARHYQIEGLSENDVQGSDMRLVQLPKGSVRGGVLTQGTMLVVTSNPDRTSPVKRGLFVLENLLGSPPAAPPPNIPALEDVKGPSDRKLSLRETLAIHRENALCSTCHNRMDPLGLALENFNALGRFRMKELDQDVDAAGVLATGEAFTKVSELKQILVRNHHTEFYRCVTDKLMTYALGRAVEYTDAHTIDDLVAKLEANEGRPSTLLKGLVHSAAFQRMRRP